jgi:hypothetical protein
MKVTKPVAEKFKAMLEESTDKRRDEWLTEMLTICYPKTSIQNS